MAPSIPAVITTILALLAGTQGNFPKTPAEAAVARDRAEADAAASEKEAARRVLGALDEARVFHSLAATYSDIEKLLKKREEFTKSLAALPARRELALAALAKVNKPEPPVGPVAEPMLAELQAAIESERAALYEIEMQLSAMENLAAGGAFHDRERVRADADEVDRARRALATGASALGPRAGENENTRIELRSQLHRELLNLYDQQEANAESFISVLRAEREAKKRDVAFRGQLYDLAFEAFRLQLAADLAGAKAAEDAAKKQCASREANNTPWDAELDILTLKTAEWRAAAAADRAAAAQAAIDRGLAGQLAEERARLQSLKTKLDSEAPAAEVRGDDSYQTIQELLKSKEIQDLDHEISQLRSLSSKARAAGGAARRELKLLESGAVADRARSLDELDQAITNNRAKAEDKKTFTTKFDRALTDALDAGQARARAANQLADRSSARLLTIQRLLDTLAEEEQVVRARGLFTRVASQLTIHSIRSAVVDFANFANSLPRAVRDIAAHEREFLTNRENLPRIWFGSAILLGSLLILFTTRRIATKIAARLPVSEKLTIVERAKRLAVGLARRMAVTGFFVVSAVVLVRFLDGTPALVRAVDASAIVVLFVRLALALATALLRPDDARFRLIPVSNATARYVWFIALLASMSVFAVAVPRNVLDAIGYTERNPGFLELLALIEQGLIVLAVVLLLAKSAVLADLIPKTKSHTIRVVANVILRLRLPFLIFAVALFAAQLAGYKFLARYLESIAVGGAAILIISALARGAVVELWHELFLKKIRFGPDGADITRQRKEFLDKVVGTLATIFFTIGSYIAFVAILRIGATELRAVDVGLVGGRRFNVSDLLYFTLAVAGTVVFAGWTRRGLELFALANSRIDVGTRYAIAVTASYLVIAFGILASLSILGFQLQDFAIVLGAAGFGVGLGMQETAGNFICGLILLFSRPVRVGDEIESEGRVGTIVDITITTTRVLTAENYEILIPNREIVGRRLVNHTGRDPKVRGIVRLNVGFGTDTSRLTQILLEIARANPAVLSSPPPTVALVDYGASSLGFELRVWCDVQIRIEVESQLRLAILPALGAANIEVAIPEQIVNVRAPEGFIARKPRIPN